MHAPTLPNHTLTVYNTVCAARGPPATRVTLRHMELDDTNIDFTILEVSSLPTTSEHRHDSPGSIAVAQSLHSTLH